MWSFVSQFLDANGKQLVFAVKKGTDSTALWKGTVRVACVKVWEHQCNVLHEIWSKPDRFWGIFYNRWKLPQRQWTLTGSSLSSSSCRFSNRCKLKPRRSKTRRPPQTARSPPARQRQRGTTTTMERLPPHLRGNLDRFSSPPQCFSTMPSKAPRWRSVAFASRGNRTWFSPALTPIASHASSSGTSITRLVRCAEKQFSQLTTDG